MQDIVRVTQCGGLQPPDFPFSMQCLQFQLLIIFKSVLTFLFFKLNKFKEKFHMIYGNGSSEISITCHK